MHYFVARTYGQLAFQVAQLEDALSQMTKQKDTLADQFAQEWGKAEAAEARFNQVGREPHVNPARATYGRSSRNIVGPERGTPSDIHTRAILLSDFRF